MSAPIVMSKQDLRRLVIAKQHLSARPRPGMLDVIRDLGCVQLDPISAVKPTHLLVLWSRLGLFDEAELDNLRWTERALFEYWAHAASLVLSEEYPVHAWHMRHQAEHAPVRKRWLDSNPEAFERLYQHVIGILRREGAVFSRDIPDDTQTEYWSSGWTSSRYVNRLLDHLWDTGEVTVVGRKGKQRQWGLSENFFPDWTPRDEWSAEQVTRFAVQKAVRALGAATPKQIKIHYTRHRYPKLNQVLVDLVNEGVLLPVQIESEAEPLPGDWYIHQVDLPLLAQIQTGDWWPRTTLLSPFDNLICDRDRSEQLFDFYYRIEIYVPKAKRQYGYYVLPILHGDVLIGRIDPKFDKKQQVLHIKQVYAEETAPANRETVQAIREAIELLAEFAGAKAIHWGGIPANWQDLTH